MNQWPTTNSGRAPTPSSSTGNGANGAEKSPTSMSVSSSASGRKTPVFSVPSTVPGEAASQETAAHNGSMSYSSYYSNDGANHGVSPMNNESKPPPLTTPNGNVNSNSSMSSYSNSNSGNQNSFNSNNSQGERTSGNGDEYSAVQQQQPQSQSQPSSITSSTTSNGYSGKSGSSDLATLLKSNGPYQPSPVNGGISSPHSTPPDSLMPNSTTSTNNTNSNDHFLVNTTTTMHHLSNLTTSMSTSTGKCY